MATGARLKCNDFFRKSIHCCARRERESIGIKSIKLYELFAGGGDLATGAGLKCKGFYGKSIHFCARREAECIGIRRSKL